MILSGTVIMLLIVIVMLLCDSYKQHRKLRSTEYSCDYWQQRSQEYEALWRQALKKAGDLDRAAEQVRSLGRNR